MFITYGFVLPDAIAALRVNNRVGDAETEHVSKGATTEWDAAGLGRLILDPVNQDHGGTVKVNVVFPVRRAHRTATAFQLNQILLSPFLSDHYINQKRATNPTDAEQ